MTITCPNGRYINFLSSSRKNLPPRIYFRMSFFADLPAYFSSSDFKSWHSRRKMMVTKKKNLFIPGEKTFTLRISVPFCVRSDLCVSHVMSPTPCVYPTSFLYSVCVSLRYLTPFVCVPVHVLLDTQPKPRHVSLTLSLIR